MSGPTAWPAWQQLQRLAQASPPSLGLLLHDPTRKPLIWQAAGVALHASHQPVTAAVLAALHGLAEQAQVLPQARAMAQGAMVNPTEGQPALHVALRTPGLSQPPWGHEVDQAVRQARQAFLRTAQTVRQGQWLGANGQPIQAVVSLGIGGSDLGPRMTCAALAPNPNNAPALRFVSTPDTWAMQRALHGLTPERTLFVVQSKSFTTPETLWLLHAARQWLHQHGLTEAAHAPHLVAVTANPQAAARAGFTAPHIHTFAPWVGGRYSVWSAVGLPLAMAIGAPAFEDFLAGARAMDEHFWQTDPAHNLPLTLALLGVWNRNFLGSPSHVVACYDSRLRHLPAYLQQLEMESNGKRVHRDGSPAQIDTAPTVWGGLGVDGQHAYFQLLHQGTHRVPVDLVAVQADPQATPDEQQQARFMQQQVAAQARALALGRDAAQTQAWLENQGLDRAAATALAPHRSYVGNVPSNQLWLDALTPFHLGALLAAYEHKVFCQAMLWDIHPFDQWGVELGKSLAQTPPP
jgi:glucose-6-phosphate isomerase